MHPGKQQTHFPGLGNVMKFYNIWKCRGKNIACEKSSLGTKKPANKY